MKKVFVLVLALMFILVGCTKPQQTGPVINQLNVSEVVDSIDILYANLEDIKFSDETVQEEITRIEGLYDQLIDDEKALVTNYADFEEIVDLYNQYLAQKAEEAEKKALIEKAVSEAAALADESVPKKSTGENIDLPTSYVSEEGVQVYIGWTTSDACTITSKGVVTQPRGTSKNVTLSAVCRSGDVIQKVEKRVVVGPLAYVSLPDKPVFAYYYSNQRALTEVERQTINVINLSFGGISLSDGSVYVAGLQYETVLQERKHGIRVCFSVQYKEGFVEWTSTAEKREVLAQSFVDVCEQYHFDGVDIDWEYPEGYQVTNYVEFMKLLYSKMKAANSNYLVTSAMYGGNGVAKYNAGESYKYMDYIHLMTYDLNSAELSTHLTALGRGSASSISVTTTIEAYANAGIPKSKLVIGGAFYGKVYELSASSTGFIRVKPITDPYSILYSKIKSDYLSLIDNPSSTMTVVREWDSAAQAPYLCITEYNTDGSIKKKYFITYDDAESLKLKSEYVFDEDLGGLMFWELGYEDRTTDDLVQSIYNVFYK